MRPCIPAYLIVDDQIADGQGKVSWRVLNESQEVAHRLVRSEPGNSAQLDEGGMAFDCVVCDLPKTFGYTGEGMNVVTVLKMTVHNFP